MRNQILFKNYYMQIANMKKYKKYKIKALNNFDLNQKKSETNQKFSSVLQIILGCYNYK
jgi:hypothetical protein